MPVNVGVVVFVKLSVLESPVSVAALRSGVDGWAGSVVSIELARVADKSRFISGRIGGLRDEVVNSVGQRDGSDAPGPRSCNGASQ